MAISWSTASASPNPGCQQAAGRGGHGVPVLQSLPHLTVLDNITPGPQKVRGLSRQEAEEAKALLLKVGLSNKAQSSPPSSPAASSSGWPSPGPRHAAAHHAVCTSPPAPLTPKWRERCWTS